MNTPKGAPLTSEHAVEQAVEQILGKAQPRPVPSAEETQAVREHVRAEWQALTSRQKSVRRMKSWAIAASVLLVVFAGFNAIRMAGVAEVPVASIDKRFGSIYMLGENSELLENNNVSTVTAGQTIITDAESGIAFGWGEGGSLRFDENTRVEFLARDSIYLRSGRVYFDSTPALAAAASVDVATLTIRTDFGDVTHIGTQYMTQADGDVLIISVRDGEVQLSGQVQTTSATRGKQLQLRGGTAVNIVDIKPYGESWEWVEQMSPTTVVDGRTVHEFLGWVSHETGMTLNFADDSIEASAMEELLKGTVDTDPTNALRIWMMASDFDWSIENGVIRVDKRVDNVVQ